MKFSDVVEFVRFAEEICPNKDLDQMIQREISTRAQQIAEYLQNNEQRFFGSMIIAVFDGTPKFLPITFADPLVSELEGKIGVLRFDGTEKYYAIDGQHRLAALKEATQKNSQRYLNDEASVIVVCHQSNLDGMIRARRLFTTVNRYAKKTSKVTNIVMDEDDGIALITRRLIRENAFFKTRVKVLNQKGKKRISLATSDAMKPSDKDYLMAIGTFYKCNESLLPGELKEHFKNKQQIPSFEKLNEGFDEINKRWNALIEGIKTWKNLQNPNENLEKFRNVCGGKILARPIGITSFLGVVGAALENGKKYSDIISCANQYSEIVKSPWEGFLWNNSSKRMFAGRERENLATRIWEYFLKLNNDYDELNSEWLTFVDPQKRASNLNLPKNT